MRYPSVIVVMLLSIASFAQNYTWLRGKPVSGVITGTYGIQGFAAPSNDPGARHGAATWVDSNGDLWMMGGEGYSGTATFSWLNDMWKYSVATNEWTWIRGSNGPNQVGVYGTMGVPAASNQPGAREFAFTWVDASGNFWLFGGDGFASTSTFGRLGDLWKYNVSSNTWTWMNGFNIINQNGVYGTQGTPSLSNQPGARYAAATYTDASGNLWMFGGRGFPASGSDGLLNDLWRYNISSNTWTWMKGSDLVGQLGTYGTLGTPAVANNPGGKEFPSSWQDPSGVFYLAFGRGYSTVNAGGYLNDMWRYDPATNNWTWIGGSNNNNPLGVYGPPGMASATVSPGGRMSAPSWRDGMGNIWIFGGEGWSASGQDRLNDLFKYDPSSGQWAYMKGSNQAFQPGVYGTQGVAAPANTPGSRQFNSWWRTTGPFWLFGAEGIDSSSVNPTAGNMNDLWRFDPPCSPDSILASTPQSICSGLSTTLTAFSQFPSSISWYTSASGGVSLTTGYSFTTAPLAAVNGPSVYTFYASANNCTTSPRASISVTVDPLPVIGISGSTVCAGSTVSLTASGAVTYTWNNGVTGAVAGYSVSGSPVTAIAIGDDANGCESSAAYTITPVPLPTVSATSSQDTLCRGQSATITASGATSYLWSNGFISTSIVVTPAASIVYSVTGTTGGCSASASVTLIVEVCQQIPQLTVSNGALFPNPTTGHLMRQGSADPAVLELFDSAGKRVALMEMASSVDLDLPVGLYFYTLRTGNSMTKGKLAIVR